MDIFFSHTTALEIIRRWDSFLLMGAEGSGGSGAPSPDMPGSELVGSLVDGLPALSGATLPLHVLVGGSERRRRTEVVCAHLARPSYPEGSFFPVAPGVWCSTPELVALQMAEFATDLELTMLVDELCGLYGIQPYARSGLVQRDRPLTTLARIERYVDEAGQARGAAKLRRALGRAREQSGSPQESRGCHRLEFGPLEGGYGISVVALNDPLTVERAGALLAETATHVRKPDLLLLAPGGRDGAPTPFRAVAVDYQGRHHREEARASADVTRRNELLACDVKDYEIAKEHYDDRPYMDWLVSRIRHDLGIPEPRLSPKRAAELEALRDDLTRRLAAADGLHWTARRRPLVMAGASDFVGATVGVRGAPDPRPPLA